MATIVEQVWRVGRRPLHRLLHHRATSPSATETEWFRICWQRATAILFMAKRLIFVTADGTPCTTRSGERANSGALQVLLRSGTMTRRGLGNSLRPRGGALVGKWQLFGATSLFSEAVE
jgi:hypothetical protein